MSSFDHYHYHEDDDAAAYDDDGGDDHPGDGMIMIILKMRWKTGITMIMKIKMRIIDFSGIG